MAGSSRFDDLRREITSLVAENDELRQMVDILRENQELRDVLRTQYNESGALLPVLESTRVDEQDQIGGQPRLNITTWERRNFVPGRGPFRFDRRRPLDTSSVSANSWLVLSPDRRQHGRSRALPDANQAATGLPAPDNAQQDARLGSSAAGSRSGAQGHSFRCSTPIQTHPQIGALPDWAFSPLGGQVGPAAQAAPQDTVWSFSTREGSRSGARCSTPIQTHPQIGTLPDWALSPLGGQAGPAAQAAPQDTAWSFPTVFSPAHTPTAMRPPYSYASLGSITPLSYISSIDDSVFTRARQPSPLSSGSIFSPVPPPGPQAVAGTQGGPQYFTFSPPLGQITVPATQPALTGSQPGAPESGTMDTGIVSSWGSTPGATGPVGMGAAGGPPPNAAPLVFDFSPTYLHALAQAHPPAVPPAPLVTTARPPPLQLPPPRRMTYPPLSLRPTQDAAPHFTLDSPFVFRPPRPGTQVTGLPPSPQHLSEAGSVFSPAHTPRPLRTPYTYVSLGSITPLSYISSIDDSVFSRARQLSPLSSGSIFSPVPPPGPQAVAGTQGGPQYFTFSPPLGQITVPATQPALTGSQPGGTESSAPGAPPLAVPPAPLVTTARPPPLQLPPPRRMTYPPLSLRPTQDAAPHFTLDSPFVFRPPRTGLPPSPQQLSQAGPVPPPYSYSSLGSFTPLSPMDLALADSVFSPAHASFSFSPQGSLTPPGPQAVAGTQGGPQYFTFSPPLGQITVPATQPALTGSQPGGTESSAPGAAPPSYSYSSLGSFTPLSPMDLALADSVFSPAHASFSFSPQGSLTPPGPQAVAGTQGGPQYFTFSPPLGQITVPATQPALTGSQPGGTESSAPGAAPPSYSYSSLGSFTPLSPMDLALADSVFSPAHASFSFSPQGSLTPPGPQAVAGTQGGPQYFTFSPPLGQITVPATQPALTGSQPGGTESSAPGAPPPSYSYSSLGSFTPLSPMDLALADSVFSPAHASFSFSPQGSLTPPGPQAVAGTQGGPQYFTFSPPLGQITVPATQPALTGSQPGGTESSAPGAPPPAMPPAPLVTTARPPPLQLPPPRRMTYPPLNLRPTRDAAPHFTLDSPFVFRPPRTGLPPSPQQLSQAGPVPPPYSYSSLGSFTPLSSMDLALADSVFSPAHASFSFSPQGSLTPPGPQAVAGTQGGPQYFTFSPPLGQITVPATQPALTGSQPGGTESSAPGAPPPSYSYSSLGSFTPLSPMDLALADSVFSPAHASFSFSPQGSLTPPGPQAVAGTQGGPQYFTFSPPLGQITVPATQPALTGSQPGGTESGPSDSGPFVLQPPPPGRKAQRPPSPGTAPAQVPFTAGPAAALSAPAQGPSVRPKERQVLTQQEMALKTSSDAKSKDTKQESMERIVGEIAFQLDRRILSAIFPDRVRLYGFTVRNIPKKVMQSGNDPYSQLSEQQASAIMERYNAIMNRLKPLGYDPNAHPRLTEQVVNTFGILRERPEMSGAEAASYNDVQNLRNVVRETVPPDMRNDCLLLLNCLHQLSQDDGKPLFIW